MFSTRKRGSQSVHYSKSTYNQDSEAAWHQHNTACKKCHIFRVNLSTKMGDVQATVSSTLHYHKQPSIYNSPDRKHNTPTDPELTAARNGTCGNNKRANVPSESLGNGNFAKTLSVILCQTYENKSDSIQCRKYDDLDILASDRKTCLTPAGGWAQWKQIKASKVVRTLIFYWKQ